MSSYKLDQISFAESQSRSSEQTTIDGDEEKGHIQETQSNPPGQPQWLTGVKLWTVIAIATAVCFLMLLDVSILSTATPKITSQFNSLADVGWYGAAYQLASGTLQPLTGKLYTNFSTKWTFITFLCIFGMGSLLCGAAVSSNMLIVARAIAGMGASGMQNGAITMISASRPIGERPMLVGIALGGAQLGLVIAPLIGGVLTQFVSWRWCFYINLPFGGVLLLALFFIDIPELVVIPAPKQVFRNLHRVLDLVGFAIFAPAAIMLLLAVQYGGNQYAWNSSTVMGLLCGAGGTFIVWLAWDHHKGDEAMIPLSMLKQRRIWTSCLSMAFLASGSFITSYYLPLYFQSVLGKSPAVSGVDLLPAILFQIVTGICAGKAVAVYGYYLPFSVISAILTTIGYGLLSTLGPTSSVGRWAGYQIMTGVGRGLGFQMPMVAAQNAVVPAQVAMVTTVLITAQTFGGALFLSFADTIFINQLRTLMAQDAPNVNATAVIAAGAYDFRNTVPSGDLRSVLEAYAKSIGSVFYLATGLAAASSFLAWGMGWVDVRKTASSSPHIEKEEGAAS